MKKRSCLETTSFNFGCALWQHWTETRLVFSLAVTQNLLRAPLIIGAWYYFARFMFDVFYVMLCGELAEGSKASWMTTPPLQGCMREIASLGHSGYRDATPEWASLATPPGAPRAEQAWYTIVCRDQRMPYTFWYSELPRHCSNFEHFRQIGT